MPIITTTTGQTGFVSDSVNYVDVGLKLDVEPTVFADDEVSIKINLEVSTLGAQIKTNSGTAAYQISTRNASTVLRLRDGETQLLAGLISSEEKTNASRVPGLGDLPVVGRLFSSQLDNSNRNELVLSITPRVLRNVRASSSADTELWVGTETQPRYRQSVVAAASTTTSAAAPMAPGQSITPSGMPGPASPGSTPNAMPGESDRPALLWSSPLSVKVGESFTVAVNLRTGLPMRGAPMQIGYSKDRFELVDVAEGDFFKQGGATTSFSKSISPGEGRVHAGVMRNSQGGAVGAGTVVTLRLKALQAGAGEFTLESVNPIGTGEPLAPIQRPPALMVQVQ